MWGRSADWIEHLIANHKIDVCTIGSERVVAGQPQIWAGLPPPMLSADNPISETGIEVCASPDSPPRSSALSGSTLNDVLAVGVQQV